MLRLNYFVGVGEETIFNACVLYLSCGKCLKLILSGYVLLAFINIQKGNIVTPE